MYEIYQKLLDEKNLKNSDVARATGISNMTLSDWKRGISKPKDDKMKKIAEFLGVTYSYLMGWDLQIDPINASTEEKTYARLKEYYDLFCSLSDVGQELAIANMELIKKVHPRTDSSEQ